MSKVGKAILWSIVGGILFLLISGDIGLTLLGIILLNYFEFRLFSK